MPVKISLIGAGSVVFAKNLMGDILQFPELSHAHICLMDIDPDRLKVAGVMARKMIEKLGVGATVSETLDQRDAVTGANFVICTVHVGGYKPGTVIDFEIPAKYGLKQTIADTLGVGGVFRALRTIPVIVDIARDIGEAAAPGCLFLNYTNPMAMNCWAIDRAVGVPHVGLCHSVQGTSTQLAGFAQLPREDVSYLVAGINHMAFFLKFEYLGQDAYPLLFKALEDPARRTELVRFEMMRRLGYFVTESSEHQSEYVPYFIHHGEEMIERFQIPINEYIRRCESCLATWERTERELLGENRGIEVRPRTHEYGSYIIHSMVTNTPRVVYGNVPNRGHITNLPERCCVELPCLVDANGVQPTRIGDLPPQLAAICQTNINVQSLAVEAALTGNRDAIYHAVMMDPHAGATLTLDQIWTMCDELIEAHQNVGLLGEFKPVLPNTGRRAAGIADRVIARIQPGGELARRMPLELCVENPDSKSVHCEVVVESAGTPLMDGPVKIVTDVPAGKTKVIPIEIKFAAEPGDAEKLIIQGTGNALLAIGETLRRRAVIDASAGKGVFEFTLAGFPAVTGTVEPSDEGLAFEIDVLDSKVPNQLPINPWEGSSLELFFAPMHGNTVRQIFVLPERSGQTPKVLHSTGGEAAANGAEQSITPMDYQVRFILPWEECGFEPGTFLFDCYANIEALGDAHSGGRAMLSGHKNANTSTTHYSVVRMAKNLAPYVPVAGEPATAEEQLSAL